MRDSIILYRSLKEATKMLDLETRAKVYDAVMDYAFDGTEPNETGVVQAMFLMMKPIIDANNQRYENGCKGGRPKNQTKTEIKPSKNQIETKVEPNKDKDKDVDKEKESVKKKVANASHFQKPTLEEVKAYCIERNNGVDAERFMDYYTANGWKVGRNPMKDWKATVRNWEKGEQSKSETVVALPERVSDIRISQIVESRQMEEEEQRKRAEEANRRSEFIKGKGYPSMIALISAGKDIYDRVMSEYKQANNF